MTREGSETARGEGVGKVVPEASVNGASRVIYGRDLSSKGCAPIERSKLCYVRTWRQLRA